MRSKTARSVRNGLHNMGMPPGEVDPAPNAPLARAVGPGRAADMKEIAGADRPPRVWRLGVRRENQELIIVVHAGPDDHDRQVPRATRLVPKLLGGKPKRIDARELRPRDAIGPEHRMGDD